MVRIGLKKRPRRTAGTERHDGPTLSSPEGLAMLAIAIVADFITPIITLGFDFLFGIGELIDYIFDIFFTATLGLWMYLRGARQSRLQRFLKRRLPLILVEYIPLVSSFSPTWVITVVLFLREGGGSEES